MFRTTVLACGLCVSAVAVSAQTMMQNTPEAVLSIAQQFGNAYLDGTDSDGRPVLGGNLGGLNYGVLFYGCEGRVGCDSLQYYASFDPPEDPLAFVNQWNYDKRFASAYLRDDGAVVLTFNLNIDFGVTEANVQDNFDIWSILLGQFNNRLNGRPDDGNPVATK